VDRAGHSAAQCDGHPTDAASNRAAAYPGAVQYFDPDAFIESQLAQAPSFRRGKSLPGDGRNRRGLTSGKGLET
jgi:hypothetical protein